MSKSTIEVFDEDSWVYIIGDGGIHHGQITNRKVEQDNTVKYSVKVDSRKTNTIRNQDQVFETLDDLYNHLTNQIKQIKNEQS